MFLMKKYIVLAAILFCATGCLFKGCELGDDDETMGELGKAEFAWDRGILGCLFGCNAEEPMATRSTAYLVVMNDEDIASFTVSSDNPEVLDFSSDDPESSFIKCEAHREGEARVILTSAATSSVIDRFKVKVRDVAAMKLANPDLYEQTLTIMTGGTCTVGIELREDGDKRLVGVGGVDYILEGGISEVNVTLVDALADLIVSMLIGSVDEYASIEALEPGGGSLSVMAPSGVSFNVPVAIVDASVVTRVEIAYDEEYAEAGDTALHIDAEAFSGGEPVHSPECQWSLTPPDGPVVIDYSGRDWVQLHTPTPASAEIACTVGSVTESRTVTFRPPAED
jgi:hypothetical protein